MIRNAINNYRFRNINFKEIMREKPNLYIKLQKSFLHKLKRYIVDLYHIVYNTITKLKVYDSPDVMPLNNFIKYLQTNDKRYFTKQFKYSPKIDKAIESFYKEYEAITADKKVSLRIEKMSDIVLLTVKYDTVSLLVNTALNFSRFMPVEQFKTIVEALEKWNYTIDINKDIFEQLEKIKNRIEGIKSRIELIETELVKEDKKEAININATLIDITRVLELNFRLKSDKLTVAEFVEYQKQTKAEIESRKRKESK